ncbi:MgtC/SapB family protein [Marixanthomonas spongiae]|uniref:MgtC/SapB family protein n=1 Tax=Marixanthomonas spongiae TaxID=2174845 RepID=A0A2U0I7T3_9FLAO|nr:MgtC/SapB family protein [Marixanthomonas spongiae]PVW17146.1 MgtC/SapB family protein [Marixanthomonas spongiae]
MNYDDLITLGIAFGLGLLVGMQRETVDNKMAGVRTFTLISILGVVSGFLAREYDNPFIIPMFGIAITTLMVVSNVIKLKKLDEPGVGQTTEVAALLIFAIGAYLVMGNQIIGVITGGVLAILLYVKEHLHGFVDSLKKKDFAAIMTFAGISLVILPILPNETFGPLDVLNPKNIWLMVTLIVGISLLGYFIYKWMGKKAGMVSNGILGGIISSTATSVSYAKKSKDGKSGGKLAAFVIFLAVTVSLIRVMIEIGVVIPNKLPQMILPFIVLFIFMAALSAFIFYRINKDPAMDKMPEPKNPAQFKSALIFGVLYGVILLMVAFAKEEFGDKGLYIVSIIGGLANKDAITLSLSHLIERGVAVSMGWRLIMTAVLSNLFFKILIAAVLGTRQLVKWLGLAIVLSILAGLLLIWLWPQGWHL